MQNFSKSAHPYMQNITKSTFCMYKYANSYNLVSDKKQIIADIKL